MCQKNIKLEPKSQEWQRNQVKCEQINFSTMERLQKAGVVPSSGQWSSASHNKLSVRQVLKDVKPASPEHTLSFRRSLNGYNTACTHYLITIYLSKLDGCLPINRYEYGYGKD